MAKLGEICTFQSGGTPSKSNSAFFGGSIPWITTVALNGGIIDGENAVACITDEAIQKSAAKIVPANSIMVGTRVGIGKVAINMVPMSTSQDVVSLINIDTARWDKGFLCKFILAKNDFLMAQARGATIKGIKIETLADLDIPELTLEEQRHISAVLDKVTDLIVQRRAQLDKLDLLVKSRFVEMFGDPEINPKGYETQKLGDLSTKISDGVHAKPTYTQEGRPFLSVVNINEGFINFEGCKFVSEEAFQKMIKSTYPERGDVLYTKVGATYGIPAYVDTDTEFCLYVSVCLIKPKHEKINSRFLAFSMGMPYIKRQADHRIKGIGVPDLHLNQIREFTVVCPPMKEQDSFMVFVKQKEETKLTIHKSLDKLETMKKALLQQYFG